MTRSRLDEHSPRFREPDFLLREELDRKMAGYDNRRGATLVPRAFVRKRPSALPDDGRVRFHDLAELYGAD